MKSKKFQALKANNSNHKAPTQEKKPEKKFVLTPDSTIVMTIQEKGRFKSRKSNAGTKEEIRKMLRSWMLKEDHTGKYTRRDISKPWIRIMPGEHVRNYYVNYREYQEPDMHECYRKLNISNESVRFFTSVEGRPYNIKLEIWEGMSVKTRLEANLEITAEGKPYTYDILN